MAHVRGGKRPVHGVAMGIIGNLADRDDACHAGRDLIERKSVDMRVKPELAGGMVRRNVDPVVRVIHLVGAVLMGRLRHRHAVGAVVDLHEDEVAEGLVAQRRRARLDDHAMGVQIGRIAKQVALAGITVMGELGRIELRQLVHQPNFQHVAFLQRQPYAAIVRDGGARRAYIFTGRPPADFVDPAGRMNHVAVR